MTTTTSNKEQASIKIIERVRALLAMGGDTSSQHEAAIAMKRARKLMDDHQVTLADIEALTKDDLGTSDYDAGSTRQKIWVSTLACSVATMNDCLVDFAVRHRRSQNKVYQFKGFKEDVKLAEFMLVYLVDTCNRLYERDKKELGLYGVADKNDFLMGMAQGIVSRIKVIINERKKSMSEACTGRSLIISKANIIEEKFGVVKHHAAKDTRDANIIAYMGGRKAAKNVQLGNFVGTTKAEVILLENDNKVLS